MKGGMAEKFSSLPDVANSAHSNANGSLPWPLVTFMGSLPLSPLEMASNRVLRTALNRRPSMFSRLGSYADKTFAIDPVDCPFVFLLEPRAELPRLKVRASLDGVSWDARISAVMLVLLGLLDGTYDGDALFFTRDLVIEGDTAAVLALRNAIEDAELDPGLLLGAPDVAAPYVSGGILGAANMMRRLLGAPTIAQAPVDSFS